MDRWSNGARDPKLQAALTLTGLIAKATRKLVAVVKDHGTCKTLSLSYGEENYKVTLVVADLRWVDLSFEVQPPAWFC